jgi:hypothetical protein
MAFYAEALSEGSGRENYFALNDQIIGCPAGLD